ncbi:MAG: UDP binding domain-containing protein, partial [Pseudomonadota bacterium]
ENCPDLRNTGVVDIIRELKSYNAAVDVFDPWVSKEEAQREYGLTLIDRPEEGGYDTVVLAVGHDDFAKAGAEGVRRYGRPGSILFDVKSLFPLEDSDGRL